MSNNNIKTEYQPKVKIISSMRELKSLMKTHMEEELKEQRNTIEINFKKIYKILEKGGEDKIYGFVIPMFDDVMTKQFYTQRNELKEYIDSLDYKTFREEEEVQYEEDFMEAFKNILKEGDIQVIFKSMVLSFLYGFLDTGLVCRDKEEVNKQRESESESESEEELKQKKKNKKRRDRKKRNKWKKAPPPQPEYRNDIPSNPPPSYSPPLPEFLPNGERLKKE